MGVDDHFVDELDQFVVCCGRFERILGAGVFDCRATHVGQHLVDRQPPRCYAKQLCQRFLKLMLGGDPVGKPGQAGEHLRQDTSAFHSLGVGTHHQQALRRVLQRYPALLDQKLPLETAVQRLLPLPSGFEGRIGHLKIARQRMADLGAGQAVLAHHQLLELLRIAAGLLPALVKLSGAQKALLHQCVVLAGFTPGLRLCGLDALPDSGCQGATKLRHALDLGVVEHLIVAVVDDLQDTVQRVSFDNGGHQHLACAVARTGINFLEEAQLRVDMPQGRLVVYVSQVEQLAAHGRVAGDAVWRDRQPDLLAAAQPGLDFGDDGCALFVDRIQG